ncbi:MAG: hypothetical protein NZ480_07065 [Bdellovibrionaceae bacterium]|nr:hypothetical protein [Pseudobdellovibrionaceae bacterium]MDW8189701.1 hypothetical protein [Pseudobdellovibrionaceae bacterium]
MATGLYLGNDSRIKEILDSFFEERKKEFGESHSLIKVTDEVKFIEATNTLAFDCIFVEHSLLPKNPNEWLVKLKKTRPSLQSPLILVGGEPDPGQLYKYVFGGWTDYLFLPPDRALVIEKFWMYTTGKRSSDIRQVYSLNMKDRASLARSADLVELSEFDCKVKAPYSISPGELMIIYSPTLASEDETGEGRVLGRCYHAVQDKQTGFWTMSFYFIGATDERLKAIRQALRRSYIASKS